MQCSLLLLAPRSHFNPTYAGGVGNLGVLSNSFPHSGALFAGNELLVQVAEVLKRVATGKYPGTDKGARPHSAPCSPGSRKKTPAKRNPPAQPAGEPSTASSSAAHLRGGAGASWACSADCACLGNS